MLLLNGAMRKDLINNIVDLVDNGKMAIGRLHISGPGVRSISVQHTENIAAVNSLGVTRAVILLLLLTIPSLDLFRQSHSVQVSIERCFRRAVQKLHASS